MKDYYKKKLIIISLFLFFILDRTAKYLALNKLPNKGVYLIDYFKLQLEKNIGIAFGISLPKFLIIILVIIIISFLLYYFLKNINKEKYLNSFLIGLIIIGAISNLIDRVIYSSVIDFIKISIWPTFNLSDAYISVAVVVLLILNIKISKSKKPLINSG